MMDHLADIVRDLIHNPLILCSYFIIYILLYFRVGIPLTHYYCYFFLWPSVSSLVGRR